MYVYTNVNIYICLGLRIYGGKLLTTPENQTVCVCDV